MLLYYVRVESTNPQSVSSNPTTSPVYTTAAISNTPTSTRHSTPYLNITSPITVNTLTPCNTTEYARKCNHSNSTNSTNSTNRQEKPHREEDKTFLAIQVTFCIIVFITGVIGNVLVLLTVGSKKMRSVKNLLIGNLAIADLTILVVSLPVTVTTLFSPWPFGLFVCRYLLTLTDVFVSVSVLTLCVIMLDRFRAIVYPFARKMSHKTTVMVTVVIWIVSYLIIAVPLINVMAVTTAKGSARCSVNWPSPIYEKCYRMVVLIVLYVLPVGLIFFCFICIGRKIRRNMRFTRESIRDSRSLAKISRRSRLVKMMFVIFLSFTICLFPIHLLLTVKVFYAKVMAWPSATILYHVAILIFVANSSMNPIILYNLSSEFKRRFREKCICTAVYVRIKSSKRVKLSLRCQHEDPSTHVAHTSRSNAQELVYREINGDTKL